MGRTVCALAKSMPYDFPHEVACILSSLGFCVKMGRYFVRIVRAVWRRRR
ncbi:hypothetical protein TPADAL_0258a [Treponema pallidum subsp. pallidum DAL-1]|uniref:Uncharacterized protein n=2 Tax=Treponema pallidum TaxID=160 RepID=A0AAU8S4R7_TREPL|nr:hypothetical protein TPChic_0258a [Treponema pallidum subsp. pallidum str. Chicago]AEZ57382.1 hypothetical protein TPESAMD_0258a [Treponema pallidum subsp. pertenue str. SamoaD]AEZ58451.1 hypothetical protein TPECDC2_0258a [Treponema pallidum subsp. pertenue str. CDC2]AEZ59519.1 hypothetical protein TPEGAU_0258a [Treponema pallidum subsp. pertenue str. Gauthier]AEZ60583.1 hypothetical protein TPADAL_0258a [Treponema pallidum subsp. pallidum DAL-1]AGK83907.1 hypothetical protein TPFB_0258a [